MIHLNNYYSTTKKEKNKHLTKDLYDKIQSEYNHYIFSKNKTINKTQFMKDLASAIGTTLSNLYYIINDGLVDVLNYDYSFRKEFSSQAAWDNRTKKEVESNSSKRLSSKDFINLVINEFRNPNNINSIDEIINDFKINRTNEINGMETICTATFYNYVDQNKIEGFNKDELPIKSKRKEKNSKREGKRNPIGKGINQRPFLPTDRTEFGHWEGDTIVGSRNIKDSGAILTLVERKTRFQLVVKLKDRKAKTVRKAFYKLKNLYPDYDIKKIIKTITFDNGVEFAEWKAIEKYLNIQIYFANPYSSWQRGSNENGNKLLRRFLPKSCNINDYTEKYVMEANELINMKIRKILNYKSSLEIFNNELALLTHQPI